MTVVGPLDRWFVVAAPALAAIAVALGVVAYVVLPAAERAQASQLVAGEGDPAVAAQVAASAADAAVASPATTVPQAAPTPTSEGAQQPGGGEGGAPTPAQPAAAPDEDSNPGPSAAARKQVFFREGVRGAGPLRLGMTLAQVEQALGEDLVVVQAATGRTAIFDVMAPDAGVRVGGIAGKVDTITLTNSGWAAETWKTSRKVKVGTAAYAVARQYPAAQRICDNEWWVRSDNGVTMKYGGAKLVTTITMTTREDPLFVACG